MRPTGIFVVANVSRNSFQILKEYCTTNRSITLIASLAGFFKHKVCVASFQYKLGKCFQGSEGEVAFKLLSTSYAVLKSSAVHKLGQERRKTGPLCLSLFLLPPSIDLTWWQDEGLFDYLQQIIRKSLQRTQCILQCIPVHLPKVCKV